MESKKSPFKKLFSPISVLRTTVVFLCLNYHPCTLEGRVLSPHDVEPTTLAPWNYSDNRILIQPCMLYNRDGGDSITFDFSKGAAAVELALEYARENIIPDSIILDMRYVNLGRDCTIKDTSVHHALQFWLAGEQCDVFMGPGCTSAVEHLYDLADYLKTPLIGMSGAGVGAQGNMNDYPFLSRISVTHTQTAKNIVKFLNMFGYVNAFFLTDIATDFYNDLYQVVLKTLRKQAADTFLSLKFRTFSSKPGQWEDYDGNLTRNLMQEAKLNARVIFLFARGSIVRDLLITASDLNMTSSEFVYVAIELYQSGEFGNFTWFAPAYDPVVWSTKHDRDQAAKSAFESMMLLSYPSSVSGESVEFDYQMRKRSPKYGHTYKPTEKISVIVGHFYDAIIFYATVLERVAANGTNVSDADAIINVGFNNNFSFISPLNGFIQMDENGDRMMDYALTKYSKESDRFLPFLLFPFNADNVSVVSELRWKELRTLPPNAPVCGFDGKAAVCRPSNSALDGGSLAGVIVGPIVFLIIGISLALYGLQKYTESKADPYWWRVFMYELMDIGALGRTRSNLGSVTGTNKMSFASSKNKSEKSRVSGKSDKSDRSVNSAANSLMADTLAAASMEAAVYRGNAVLLLDLPDPKLRAIASFGKELHPLKTLLHVNVHIFFGIGVNDENLCQYVIGELCSKGNLPCLLQSKSVRLDDPFKNSLMMDLVSGMVYLHSIASVGPHGDLRDTCCLVDSRFVLKVSGHGLSVFRSPADFQPPFEHQTERDFYKLLWRAPELLRGDAATTRGSLKGDVYSFGVVVQQIILKAPPYAVANTNPDHDSWDESGLKAKDIVLEVKRGIVPPVRPRVPRSMCHNVIVDLLDSCWEESPLLRPYFPRIQAILRTIPGFNRDNVIDHLFSRMEQYAGSLEQQVEEKTKRFMDEKRRGEEILSGLLPKFVARMLNKGHSVAPEIFPSVTIYFSHLEGFTEIIAASKSPAEMTLILNSFYMACDGVIEAMDVYKVETVGDAYMIVSGLPIPNGTHHADIISAMSLTLMDKVRRLMFPNVDTTVQNPELRIGINSGPCVAGIVGLKLPRYCLFGDAVNTASRMESNGEAGKIHISSSTQTLLEFHNHFEIEERGEIQIKGKGVMKTFWLKGYRESIWMPAVAKTSLVNNKPRPSI